MTAGAAPITILLAASGGGHVRQLLDLEPVWRDHRYSFVTEDTALGRSIAASHPSDFVAHVAWGQAKLGAPLRMIASGWRNLVQSWRIVRARRPDVILTTGAGSMAATLLWGRLFGARIVLIDSFARFAAPSLFARLTGWLAHERIAQSAASAARWPGARLFDPFRRLDGPRPPKEPLIFATVGATLAFERLTRLVVTAHERRLLPGRLVLQVGEGVPLPAGIDAHETLDFAAVQELLARAELVICHAGTGSLITSLRAGCHVIAVPRLHALGEHYDDHQLEIATMFASRGLLQIARDDAEMAAALAGLPGRDAPMATTDPRALIAFLQDWLATIPHRTTRES